MRWETPVHPLAHTCTLSPHSRSSPNLVPTWAPGLKDLTVHEGISSSMTASEREDKSPPRIISGVTSLADASARPTHTQTVGRRKGAGGDSREQRDVRHRARATPHARCSIAHRHPIPTRHTHPHISDLFAEALSRPRTLGCRRQCLRARGRELSPLASCLTISGTLARCHLLARVHTARPATPHTYSYLFVRGVSHGRRQLDREP